MKNISVYALTCYRRANRISTRCVSWWRYRGRSCRSRATSRVSSWTRHPGSGAVPAAPAARECADRVRDFYPQWYWSRCCPVRSCLVAYAVTRARRPSWPPRCLRRHRCRYQETACGRAFPESPPWRSAHDALVYRRAPSRWCAPRLLQQEKFDLDIRRLQIILCYTYLDSILSYFTH